MGSVRIVFINKPLNYTYSRGSYYVTGITVHGYWSRVSIKTSILNIRGSVCMHVHVFMRVWSETEGIYDLGE